VTAGYYDREASRYDDSRGGVERAGPTGRRPRRPAPRLEWLGQPGHHEGRELVEADARGRVLAVAGRAGLAAVGESSFAGPSEWGSASGDDPVFRVVAFRRG
jgi:hypothetical protein